MTVKSLSARDVLRKAIASGTFSLTDSEEALLDYFSRGVAGHSGFLVEGDLERFASYFLLSASGQSGALTDATAAGASGFLIKGDYQLAWSKRFIQAAADGTSGFLVSTAVEAQWCIDKNAAQLATAEMRRRHPKVKQVSMTAVDGSMRKEWMDLYIQHGGIAEVVGSTGVRLVKFMLKGSLVDRADTLFFQRFPDRKGRSNTNSEEDGPYRKARMAIYSALGGKTVEIGKSGVRIPTELTENPPDYLTM